MCFRVITILLATAIGILADTIRTNDGKTYDDIKVTGVSEIGMSISHSDGVARVSWSELSESDRKKYGFDKIQKDAPRREAARQAQQKQFREKLGLQDSLKENDYPEEALKLVREYNALVSRLNNLIRGHEQPSPLSDLGEDKMTLKTDLSLLKARLDGYCEYRKTLKVDSVEGAIMLGNIGASFAGSRAFIGMDKAVLLAVKGYPEQQAKTEDQTGMLENWTYSGFGGQSDTIVLQNGTVTAIHRRSF